ncbi:MAG TPA: DUF4153 domain-containing protein [Tissierellaceae bacterium]
MGLLNRVKLTVLNIKNSLKRFPITIGISSLLAFLLIYLIEAQPTGDIKETLEKIALTLGLGILVSLCIVLLIEKFFQNNRLYSILLYFAGGLFLVLYYFVFLDDLGNAAAYRYVGTVLFLVLAFLFIPRIKNSKDYEYYILDVLQGFAITFIYSFVLYAGISVILLTINQLFEIDIKSELYLYTFIIVVFIFAVSLFLSKLPSIEKEYNNVIYNKSLKVLLTYIVIPLISIYTIILYLYFAKIIITGIWPRGLVSHLVLWYSTLSVGVIFLLTPIMEENRVAKLFYKVFPKVILPILLMMFLSIYQRVAQYGITENRYFIIVLGLWVLGIMIYFSLKKSLRNIIIPISLAIVVLISVYGPLSSFSIAKFSQNRRFEKILKANNMLIDDKIVPNEKVSKEDQREISNIISYFSRNHSISDIKYLPVDFTVGDMESIMGFEYNPYFVLPVDKFRYFYYAINSEEPINVGEFEYLVNINSWQENEIELGELIVKYNRQNNLLTIKMGDAVLLQQDMLVFTNDIYNRMSSEANDVKNLISMKDMTYDVIPNDANNYYFRFIIRSVSGRVDEGDKVEMDSIEFILLVGHGY